MAKQPLVSRPTKTLLGILLAISGFLNIGCQKKKTDSASTSSKYLYFASGACNVGNLTASKPYAATQSGFLGRVDVNAGATIETVYDYSPVLGEFPVGFASFDTDRLIVGVETNATNRRIDLVSKASSGNASGYASGSGSLATVFSTVFRSIVPAIGVTGQGDAGSVNGYLISRSSAIEKISLTKQRQFPLNLPTSPWLNAPAAANCASSATNINTMLVTPNGKIIYTHSTAAQNRVAVINGLGYGASTPVTNDCLSGLASPDTTNSFPTAMVYIPNPSGTSPQVLVYYSSATLAKDYLYRYDYNDTTGAITGGTLLYQNGGYLRGVSAMAYDATAGALYFANGSTLLPNSIEKFTYDPVSFTMTRVTGASGSAYIPATTNTQCINSMMIDN